MNISDCSHFPNSIAKPKATVCEECEDSSHLLGLRACAICGHVGCCESDPNQHAKKHAESSGHQVMASYPADEKSFLWCYEHNDYLENK